jgi:superfamily II DNA helicase RecQ
MNIKVFNIRLSKEFCQLDQDRMNHFLETVEVKLTSTSFVTTNTSDYWSAVVFYSPKNETKKKVDKLTTEELSSKEQIIFNALRRWRNDLALKLDWNPYRICHNAHLIAIAKANPNSKVDLEEVTGFGSARIMKYGDDIIAVLNAL